MSELFDEVDEDVRRDQLKKLWEQYSLYIIAGALLIIASVGGWRGYQYVEARKAAEGGRAFDKAVELSEANKHTEAEAGFAELAAKGPSGTACWRGCAWRRRSPNCDDGGGRKAVRRDYCRPQRRCGRSGSGNSRRPQLLLETMSYPDMKERLEAAAAPGSTFRHTARELLALSAWRANDAAATRQWLDMIANDGETPPSLRSRAEALQALLPPVAKS